MPSGLVHIQQHVGHVTRHSHVDVTRSSFICSEVTCSINVSVGTNSGKGLVRVPGRGDLLVITTTKSKS